MYGAGQRLRVDACLVVRQRGAKESLAACSHIRLQRRVPRRLCGERAGGDTGWDGQGANVSMVVVRTEPDKGGTEGLSAILVERGTPGVTYNLISKMGHRLTPNAEIIFENARVPVANLIEGTKGNGDLLINRAFAWSGPVAGIAAVGVARAAYELALKWCKTYTSGGTRPIIQYQNVGYILGDVAARIEACGYFCWKTAHYLDQNNNHGELMGAR